MGETHAMAGKPVEVRRFVVAPAKAGQVGIAQVVSKNEDDVGPCVAAGGPHRAGAEG